MFGSLTSIRLQSSIQSVVTNFATLSRRLTRSSMKMYVCTNREAVHLHVSAISSRGHVYALASVDFLLLLTNLLRMD